MDSTSPIITPSSSRRDFIKTAAGASVLAGIQIPYVHAAGSDAMKAVLIGCGGRGTGAAANALNTKVKAPIKLVAMADVNPNKLQTSFESLTKSHPDVMSVSEDSKFIGFDGYAKAMDMLSPGDVAICATPLAFRWVHFKYAIEKGINIFMEKPVCADGPTAKRLLALNEEAKKKGIKVAIGLMCRHCRRRMELADRIHNGDLGELILGRAYRMSGPIAQCFVEPRDKAKYPSELLWQIENFHGFLWASGGSFSDFLIHNIDEMCWMKNDWPVEAHAMTGRSDRGTCIDQNMDTYSVEYTFKDGTKCYMEGRNVNGCYMDHSTEYHGTKGLAIVSTGGHGPSAAMGIICKGHNQVRVRAVSRPRKNAKAPAGPEPLPEGIVWSSSAPNDNPYDLEWQDFMDAIRNNKPYNELERGVQASVVTSMGRMSAHTGRIITYDDLMNCPHEFAPNADKLTLDGPAPLIAGPDGKYPIPQPGIIKDTEYKV